MQKLVDKLRNFIKEKNAGALLVNSTNEFLTEYNVLDENSRYFLTGFSGSTGDALLTMDKLYLFVDGRYHEQADFEVDKKVVTVVKLKLGQSYLKELVKRVPKKSVLLTTPSKNPNYFEEMLVRELIDKSTSIAHLDTDIVAEFCNKNVKKCIFNLLEVPINIAGICADEKFKKVSATLSKNEVVVITSIEDVAYLTNLRAFEIPYSSSFFAKAIVSKDNAVIYADCKLHTIGKYFKVNELSEFDLSLSNFKNKNVLLSEKSISAQDYLSINSTNKILPSEVYKFKTIKNDFEIEHIKTAFERTDKALGIVEEMLNSKKIYSELDIYNELEKSFFKHGAKSLSFKPIVAAGKNSSIIHYSKPNSEVFINAGDFLLVDCGAYYEGGYATDITRTFIKGKPSSKQKKIYTTVLKAFLNAYNHSYTIKSQWFDIDKVARSTIDKVNNTGFTFSHSTGHGVGISVHEAPPVVAPAEISKTNIQSNCIFTIEPGIYKKNWGGVRLENTVLSKIIGNKVILESFSHYHFEEKLVDYDMLTSREKKWLKNWQGN